MASLCASVFDILFTMSLSEDYIVVVHKHFFVWSSISTLELYMLNKNHTLIGLS